MYLIAFLIFLLKFLDRGVGILKDLYAGSVRLGKLSQAKADAILAMLKPTTNWSDLKDVDTVGIFSFLN